MAGKSVALFLKTPLYPFSRGKKGKMPRNVVQLRGTVVKEKGGGVWLRVEAMGPEGDSIDNLAYKGTLMVEEIYIPFSKVDFMMFL